MTCPAREACRRWRGPCLHAERLCFAAAIGRAARLSKTLNLLRFEDAPSPARVIDPRRRRTGHGLFVENAED